MKYMIIFSLDGYDEVSLTSEFKYILNGVEQIVSPEMMDYKRAVQSGLNGGRSVPEAADLFMKILKGEGTTTQNECCDNKRTDGSKMLLPFKIL